MFQKFFAFAFFFALLLAGVFAFSDAPHAAGASVEPTPTPVISSDRRCVVDPIVVLSDGRHVILRARIGTDAANVTNVAYVVHSPVGTSLDRVIYTGPDRFPETVTFVADTADGSFWTDTLVTSTVTVPVDASTQVRDDRVETSGTTGQHLVVTINP
jgi:hypothetical protein